MKTFIEPQKQLPVSGSYDTVVVGGGFAGIAAALAAARGGNKVLLCERMFLLGGLGTAGLVTIYLPLCDGYGHQVSFGIAEELLKRSIAHGHEARYPKAWLEGGTAEEKLEKRYLVQYNASLCAIEMEKILLEAGVELLYGTTVCDVAVEEGVITHLLLENKSGRSAVEVKNVIDCSGDADVCHFAGEDTAIFGDGNILAAWYYYCDEGKFNLELLGFKDIKPDYKPKVETEWSHSKKRYVGIEAAELSEMTVESHDMTYRHFLSKGDLNENHMLGNIAIIPQVRMTRRLKGVYEMTEAEERKYFDDSVGLYPNWRKKGPIFELPFSVLHGKKIRNLAVAGRCISAADDLLEVARVIPVCAVTGEAVGTAAALCQNFDEVDIRALQAKLRENGVKLHVDEVL